MKKSLLVLAVLGAFAGVASAQSSVTIYGSFDGGVRNITNTNAAAQSKFTVGSSGTYNSNRIGFKGVEDLGGGANAHFVLENGFNTGTGAAAGDLFGRSAYVGLGGTWGSLDFGRQYTVAFKTIGAYDPFVYKYTGIVPAVLATAGVRYNNDIQYTSAFSKEITVRAEYALGETTGSTSAGAAQSVGASYADGTFNVGGAYTKRGATNATTPATATLPASVGDNKHYTVGAGYKFGPAKLTVGYANEKQESLAGTTSKTEYTWGGVAYAITPALEATYAHYQTRVTAATLPGNGKKDMDILGATYALSKRTNLYAEIDASKFSGTGRVAPTSATPQTEQTGVSVGVNHQF